MFVFVTRIRKLLYSINGVLLPGGGAPFKHVNGYYDAVTKIYNVAKEVWAIWCVLSNDFSLIHFCW